MGKSADAATTLTPEEAQTVASYEENAQRWAGKRTNPGFWAPELELFSRILPAGRVLDIGSGNGRDATLLSDAGYEVTGLDLSQELLALAREAEPRASFIHDSFYELPFADRGFDRVWATASLLHAPRARVQGPLSEIARILRPGGAALITLKEGHGEELDDGEVGQRFFAYWQPEEFSSELKRAGLSPHSIHRRVAGDATWLAFLIHKH